MSKKLFVGNLSWGIDPDGLSEIFSEYGTVVEAIIIRDEQGRSKGFGFVTLEEDDAADKAIEALDGNEIEGRTAVVNEARPREERPRNY